MNPLSIYEDEYFYLVAAVRQHVGHALVIGLGDEDVDVEMTFTLVRLLGQDVSRVRMAALNLSGGGQAKPLRRTFVCF